MTVRRGAEAGRASLPGLRRAQGSWILLGSALMLTGACGTRTAEAPAGAPSAAPTAPPGGGALAAALREPAASEEPCEPAPPLPELPPAAVAALRGEIDAILDDPVLGGTSQSVRIVGHDSGQLVYERNAAALLKPASNTKLVTTVVAWRVLGQEHRSGIRALAQAVPSPSGVVAGDLVLALAHEPSLTRALLSDERFALDELAVQLRQQGVVEVAGAVVARGELVYGGAPLGSYDAERERGEAAAAFRAALEAQGVTVHAVGTSPELSPPEGWQQLAFWPSFPLSVVCSPINRSSHNELADLLARQLGFARSGKSSLAAGGEAMVAALGELGIDTAGVRLNDGSGLSHDNRLSAAQLVTLLGAQLRDPSGELWLRTLSLAGVRGTVAGRLQGGDTVGRVHAKTGTLDGVVALSGVLDHRYDGQRYLFALLLNGSTDPLPARAAHDRIVEALAADRRGLGDRPAAPRLLRVTTGASGAVVRLAWGPVAGAQSYLVWRSPDGQRWRREDARLVRRTSHQSVPFEPRGALYVRVQALGAAGSSDPSNVYATRPSPEGARVLLVDANERWQREPAAENPAGYGHDFVAVQAETVRSLPFDSCAHEALRDGSVELAGYDVVVWVAGQQSTGVGALDAAEQTLLGRHLRRGGALFASGSELGWMLDEKGDEQAQRFFAQALHAHYAGDDAGTYFVRGAGVPFSSLGVVSFFSPDGLLARTPDVLEPVGGSSMPLAYVGGRGGSAATAFSGRERVLVLGFPLESVAARDDRERLMDAALGWLLRPPAQSK